MFKAYNYDSDRYSGAVNDNFERKYALYLERCDQNDLSIDACRRGFSIMLCGQAREYYFDKLRHQQLALDQLADQIRTRFNTEERTRALLRNWESLTLSQLMLSELNKTGQKWLEILVGKLHDIQASLPSEYRTDLMMKNRLLNAVRDVEQCRLACHKPADTVQGVIYDLHSSLSLLKSGPVLLSTFPAVRITDRRYFSAENRPQNFKKRACFVCGKEGCWSTKQNAKERLQAFRKNHRIRQFVTEVIGAPEENINSDSELADALEEVEIHIQCTEDADDHDKFECRTDDKNENRISTVFISNALSCASIHAISAKLPYPTKNKKFKGVTFDTGAARASSGTQNQYLAYCTMMGINPSIDTSQQCLVRFGLGEEMSKGTANIRFPIKDIWLDFNIHVVETDVPILICIDDMDRIGVYLNNLTNTLHHPASGSTVKISRIGGHPFLTWNPVRQCHFTVGELHRLHRRFGHPSADKLANLLSRTGLDEAPAETRKVLEDICKRCVPCQTFPQAPRRFKFRLKEDVEFNHTVYVDIFYIQNKPVLHVVDEATHYQAARWLSTVSAESIWRALRLCWIDTYLGPPDIVCHDAGKSFLAQAFSHNSATFDIKLKSVPVEAPQSMSIVERYHAPVRRAFNIIRTEAPSLDEEAVLQTAVKAVNDSVGSNGLVPTLLVYGALPRLGLPSYLPSPSLYQRARALRLAVKEVTEYFAKAKISSALQARNGPQTMDIHNVPLGGPVLVYRPNTDRWEGPFALLDKQNEDFTVLMNHGPSKFCSTRLKPFHHPRTENGQGKSIDQSAVNLLYKPQCHTTLNQPSREEGNDKHQRIQFAASRQAEFNQLLERGLFDVVNVAEAKGHRIYGARFVDQIKHAGTPQAFEKSRLVIQGFKDKNHGLVTYAPTVLRISQRVLLCIAAMFPSFKVFARNVRQVYTQSETKLTRTVFISPPKELEVPSGYILRVIRPLYGLPESGVHWYQTYHRHHTNRMCMIASLQDPCFLYTATAIPFGVRNDSKPCLITCLQTDDTLNLGNHAFLSLEQCNSKKYAHKPRGFLTKDHSISFNGGQITYDGSLYSLSQPDHISKLRPVSTNVTKEQFISTRARGAYLASVSRPDLAFRFSFCSQFQSPTPEATLLLNETINRAHEHPFLCLRFCELEMETVYLAVYADASFANNPDSSSQLGMVLCLADKRGFAIILHYSSTKSRRVARSALAAELFALVHAFDQASTICITLNTLLSKKLEMVLYTDSRSLYECLVRVNGTAEKRLLIDLAVMRQAHERREIASVIWIPSPQNPADALTKMKTTSALQDLMENHRLCLSPQRWVDRPVPAMKLATLTLTQSDDQKVSAVSE